MTPDRLYNVIVQPRFSEKATRLAEASNQYVFNVVRDATKSEIKEAVETLFKVKVKGVTTLNMKGKVKRTARGETRKNHWKKAYVRVESGQQIDFATFSLEA